LLEWSQKIREKSPRGLTLVIGASRGIGRALVHQLSCMGFGVVSASRTAAEGGRAALESDRVSLDITNPLSRESFVSLMKSAKVDFSTVIFNAGVLDSRMRNASQVDHAELRNVFETNLFSIIDLNTKLMPLYKSGSTVLFVSSYMGLPANNDFNCSTYRLSKCAMTLYARELGKEMIESKRDVAVAALHPGSVLTELNPQGRLSPEESALRIALMLDPARRRQILERNGEFWMAKEKDVRIDPWII
jgi:NAD(P)-dependent dehydrogenase (short-subunit alcohol dehydrogenase family)